jgi:hypothetical protein
MVATAEAPAALDDDASDLTIRVGFVLDYRDTAEIRRYLAVMAALGFVPRAEWESRGRREGRMGPIGPTPRPERSTAA